jgi:Tol biopolymer transport system component
MKLFRVGIDEESGKVSGAIERVTTPEGYVIRHLSFARNGDLAYAALVRGKTLHRVPFDPARGALAGKPRQLTADSSLVDELDISPDGQWIACRITQGGRENILLLKSDGAGEQQLLTNDAYKDRGPRWSPDGGRIAYVANGTFFALGEEQLGNTETSAIHVVDVATGVDRTITNGDWLDVNPWWTADGRGLIFVSNRTGGRDVYRARLSRSGAMEGEPERITSGLSAHSISFSRDRTLLAYSSLMFRANIWSIPIPNKHVVSIAEARQLTFGSEKTEKLEVSPDGQWLAYDSDRSGNADVWKVRIAGGDPEQVTRDAANEFVNDWAPDASEILYQTTRGDTGRDIKTVTLDGTRTTSIVATPEDEQHGTWSPDGNGIAFVRGRSEHYRLFVMRRAGRDSAWTAPRQLTSELAIDPKWSYDGKQIAFTRRGEVWLISPDGINERALTTPSAASALAQYAIWSPDDKTIYFKAADGERRASIWAVPAAGGAPRLLVRFDDPLRPSLRREFATDGLKFFFTIAQDESDVWIAQVR